MTFLLLIALIVGTLLYRSEMGWRKIGIYWAIFFGALLLVLIVPSYVVLLIHIVVVACYFAHAKLSAIPM